MSVEELEDERFHLRKYLRKIYIRKLEGTSGWNPDMDLNELKSKSSGITLTTFTVGDASVSKEVMNRRIR